MDKKKLLLCRGGRCSNKIGEASVAVLQRLRINEDEYTTQEGVLRTVETSLGTQDRFKYIIATQNSNELDNSFFRTPRI